MNLFLENRIDKFSDMWLQWFLRYSTQIMRWPIRIVCDECKRHRYKLSFGPLLFTHNRNCQSINLNQNHWRNDPYEHHQFRYEQKNKKPFRSFAPSIFAAFTGAAVMFSWEQDGISDEELYVELRQSSISANHN